MLMIVMTIQRLLENDHNDDSDDDYEIHVMKLYGDIYNNIQ